jgi:predicted choloylglycine hydrolase
MNERGLAVGMAAVPDGEMQSDPQKPNIGQLRVIREILDHAATVAEAVEILGAYNIDMSEVPIHYLVASAAGEAALVEFYRGEMVVTHNSEPWHAATNFLVASTNGNPAGQCPRYDRIQGRMDEAQGLLTSADAFDLLGEVSQDNTQWSVVYNMKSGAVQIVMGRQYEQETITLELEMDR